MGEYTLYVLVVVNISGAMRSLIFKKKKSDIVSAHLM